MTRDRLGEALRDLVAEKLAETKTRGDRTTVRAATSVAKQRLKAELRAEAMDTVAQRLSALDLWTRVPPSGRRPRLSREDLAATAMRLADAEGTDALSMRRLAAELDVGTMTLYHYVRTKDELLTLVTDAFMGEVVVPPDTAIPPDWRPAMTLIATRTRDAVLRHPWILDINDDPPIGPNSVRHFDQCLQAIAPLHLPLAEGLDIVAVVDDYVLGYLWNERNSRHDQALDDEEHMVGYVSVLIETGAYPHLAALTDEMGVRSLWRSVHAALRDDSRFSRNLDRVLDGIEASLDGRATSA